LERLKKDDKLPQNLVILNFDGEADNKPYGAYLDENNWENYDVYMYDITTGKETQLTIDIKGQKNIRFFLKVASRIIEKYSDVEFVLIGSGPLFKEITHSAGKMGIETKIHFMGFQKDIVKLINAFDIFILTSITEGLPNVLLEAQADS